MIEVYMPGTRVKLGDPESKFEGVVTGVGIYGPGGARTMYLVSWWDDSTHYEQWLEEFDVYPADEEAKQAVGFRKVSS